MSTPSLSADDIFVSLEPPPLAEDPTLAVSSFRNLSQIIPQIAQERGSFINVTEDKLRKEIEEASQSENESPDTTEPSQVKQIAPTDLTKFEEDFNDARAELTRLISAAQNEAAISLDFVSLLISSVRPAAGTTSMSPHLKSHVPVGSLGSDKIKPHPYVEDPSVCLGWKVQAVSAASDRLAEASERLAKEAVQEQKYWDQVEQVAVAGEVLSKMRTSDFRGMGVRYGFVDAGSTYKEKGIATLRRNVDGNLVLKTEGEKRTKVLSVEVLRPLHGQYIRTGQYASKISSEAGDVKCQIKQARDLLFEDELFFQVARETRILGSQGITLDFGNKVMIPLPDLQVVIETIDLEDQYTTMELDDSSDNVMAEAINIALHLLLSMLHRKTLKARRAIPLPLGTRTNTTDAKSEILSPLVSSLAVPPIKDSLVTLITELTSGLNESNLDSNGSLYI
ncbi:mediator complex, subunit Med17 [Lipomyces kononenkoae]|uniref:Mediator complex, subunit Med17 n=1 Tax=Lipomyces kononenkoae TaxID=34357 RepID=A0ACC3SYJ6_LIPKO